MVQISIPSCDSQSHYGVGEPEDPNRKIALFALVSFQLNARFRLTLSRTRFYPFST